jgi:hypothetical protein
VNRFEHADNATIVASILRVSFPDAHTAIDLTPGSRNFWSETIPINVTVSFSPFDFTALPYADGSVDVALIDPPHLADCGSASVMRQRYGTYRASELRSVVQAGARDAMRVGRVGAIVKICDHIHEGRFQNMTRWVEDVLGDPYDVIHRVGHRTPTGHNWHEQLSARNNGSTFLVFRHGSQTHKRRHP